MPTPDRFPGEREDEAIVLDDRSSGVDPGPPAKAGEIRRVSESYQAYEAATGAFDIREDNRIRRELARDLIIIPGTTHVHTKMIIPAGRSVVIQAEGELMLV